MTVSYHSDISNTPRQANLSIALGTLADGDIISLIGLSDDNAANHQFPSAPTCTGITFSSRQNITTTSHCNAQVYTGVVNVGGAGSKTVTWAKPTVFTGGTSGIYGAVAGVFPTADGYSLAATPAVMGTGTTGSGAPSGTITTVGTNSLVFWGSADWLAKDGASRNYRSSAADQGYERDAPGADATHYWGSQAAAVAGAQTCGLTAPVAQTWTLVGVEIKFTPPAAGFEGWGVRI